MHRENIYWDFAIETINDSALAARGKSSTDWGMDDVDAPYLVRLYFSKFVHVILNVCLVSCLQPPLPAFSER